MCVGVTDWPERLQEAVREFTGARGLRVMEESVVSHGLVVPLKEDIPCTVDAVHPAAEPPGLGLQVVQA